MILMYMNVLGRKFLDNEIFKNWWKDSMKTIDPLENAFVVNPSTTVPTYDGYNTNHTESKRECIINSINESKIVDIRMEMIDDLHKQIIEIYKALADHEKRISNLERK